MTGQYDNKEEKIFCGSAKQTHEMFINGSICLDDFPQELRQVSPKNGKTYLNITIGKKREVGQYGDTHYITVNTFKPKAQGQPQGGQGFPQPDTSDIPF